MKGTSKEVLFFAVSNSALVKNTTGEQHRAIRSEHRKGHRKIFLDLHLQLARKHDIFAERFF